MYQFQRVYFQLERSDRLKRAANFRFCKQDSTRMMSAGAWEPRKRTTKRKRINLTTLVATGVILRRFVSPGKWKDPDILIGKHASQMSEIFWEALEHMLEAKLDRIKGSIST